MSTGALWCYAFAAVLVAGVATVAVIYLVLVEGAVVALRVLFLLIGVQI